MAIMSLLDYIKVVQKRNQGQNDKTTCPVCNNVRCMDCVDNIKHNQHQLDCPVCGE